MRKPNPHPRLFAFIAVVALLAASCGDDSSDTESTTADTAAPEVTEPETSEPPVEDTTPSP